jgi:predicted metalloprotease with PDZ domain
MTSNQKSLTDFERIFLGKGGNTGPLIAIYDFDELVRDLNQVVPYDWAAFLRDRVYKINPRADLAGIEQGGYRLIYTDHPNASEKTMATNGGRRNRGTNAWYSIGLHIGDDGSISDVRWNGPADKAGIAPGQKILAVNGEVFSGDLLRGAIRDAKGKTEPIHLILQSDSFVSSADIDYHDGERYPVLERAGGLPAYLDDITKPLVTSKAASAP